MTRYGWDASNHDWTRGPMDLAKAKAEGIDLFTHKSSEGSTFTDPNFDEAMTRAQAVWFPVCGSYHVLWPNSPVDQADFWFSRAETYAPWWRQHPCWVWQIDAELFQNFQPYRKPTVVEINACGDRIVALARCQPTQVVVYAPEWLYGDGLAGLKYRQLWSSRYVTASGEFKAIYPGDDARLWQPYSGITPVIAQYSSSATIAGQSPADANAVRVDTVADLQNLFLKSDPPEVDLTPEEHDALMALAPLVDKLTAASSGNVWDELLAYPGGLAIAARLRLATVDHNVDALTSQVSSLQQAVVALTALVKQSPALSGTLDVSGTLTMTEQTP